MIQPPKSDEYFEYYGGYIRFVPPDADVFALMATQPEELRALLRSVSEAQAEARPAPGEWSIKEVLGHVTDTERVMSFRAVWIVRGNATPLPGFDQDDFVRGTDFNRRSLRDLLDEFAFQRQANLLCFRALTEAEIDRRGTASGYPFSTRALLYILPGHVMHHIESLKRDYHVEG